MFISRPVISSAWFHKLKDKASHYYTSLPSSYDTESIRVAEYAETTFSQEQGRNFPNARFHWDIVYPRPKSRLETSHVTWGKLGPMPLIHPLQEWWIKFEPDLNQESLQPGSPRHRPKYPLSQGRSRRAIGEENIIRKKRPTYAHFAILAI